LTIITGSPGAGKTTLAAQLASLSARGVHISGDIFYSFVAHPITPTLPESLAQNTAVIRATVRSASAFAMADYDVYLEGIFGPWFLPVVARELQSIGHPVAYVILRLTLQEAIRRTQDRDPDCDEDVVRQMNAAFCNLGEYERYVLPVGSLTTTELSEEFHRCRPQCFLDLEAIAGDQRKV
jgi:tRNA uridine 5-carbamoylmethylation protein Kti12